MQWIGSLRTKAFALLAFACSVIDYWRANPEALESYRRAMRDGRIRYKLDPGDDTWIHPDDLDFDLGITWLDCEELSAFGAADDYLRGMRDLWIGLLVTDSPLAHGVYWRGTQGMDPSVSLGMAPHPLWSSAGYIRLPVRYDAPQTGKLRGNNAR